MSCVSRRDLCVVRGDVFIEIIGFGEGWTEIAATPEEFEVSVIFRDAHDDTLTPHLTLTGTPAASTDDMYDALVYLSATAAETSTLPAWNHVCHAEVRKAGGDPTRLYQGKVKVSD